MISPRLTGHVGDGPQAEASLYPERARACRIRITRPEPGSLYHLMHDHAGTSLYVLPICWTDLHAELLGARFTELQPVLRPVPGPHHCGWDASAPSQTAQMLSRELSVLLSSPETARPFLRSRVIKTVMSTLFPLTLSRPKTSAELDLYFGTRVFRQAVRLPIVWLHPESCGVSFDSEVTRLATPLSNTPTNSYPADRSSGPNCRQLDAGEPILAFISRAHITYVRHNLYRILRGPDGGDTGNIPVSRLQSLRSKLLIPANADHDAHFVAIFLAMAQSHFYRERSPRSTQSLSAPKQDGRRRDARPERFHDVRVQLVTAVEDSAELIVYTATVSGALLQCFAYPSKAPQAAGDSDSARGGMDISFARVPVWPVLGLKERLGRALGRHIAGDAVFDSAEDIETWGSSQPDGHRAKRRRDDRDLFAEVLNSSFEAEDDDDCSVDGDRPVLSPNAKRRCTRRVNPLKVC